jgi:hypothetical protein
MDSQLTIPANTVSGLAKHPHGNNRGLKQAYDFRDLAANEAMMLKDEAPKTIEERVSRAQALRSLAYVWSEASERIRIIKGKPMPGSLRPVAKTKKAKTVPLAPSEQPSVDP